MPVRKQEEGDGDAGGKGIQKYQSNQSKGRNNHENTNGFSNGNRREIKGDTKGDNKWDIESQAKIELGGFTDAAQTALQSMVHTDKAIRNLTLKYSKYLKDIERMDEIMQRSRSLETQCKYKDGRIKQLRNTVDTLQEMSQERQGKVEKEMKNLAEEKRALEEDRIKVEKDKVNGVKRIKVQEVEQEKKLQEQFEKRAAELEGKFKDFKKDLEDSMQKLKDGNRQQVATLEADKSTILEKIENLEKEKRVLEGSLAKAEDDFDDLKRTKESYKTEKLRLEKKLEAMENEFGLTTQTVDFYIKEFAKMSRIIEKMSVEYFKEPKDTDTNVPELIEADKDFISIPISQTKESQDLRIAYAQHVISASLTNIVWQPFSSEKTFLQPEAVPLLQEISNKLARSSHGKSSGQRAAKIWNALTMRALQFLSPASTSSPPGGPHAEGLVEKVLFILSPHISPSQEPQFRVELLALANLAISVWSSAQTGDLQLTVSLSLDRDRYDEWRSLEFDPPSPSADSNTTDSSKFPRIFTLFPRITALKPTGIAGAPVDLSGGWSEPDQEPRTIETCIHRGMGLPEWSALVVKGMEERDEVIEVIERKNVQLKLKALEEKKREVVEAWGERNGKYSRRGSGVVPGPTSLSGQEKMEVLLED